MRVNVNKCVWDGNPCAWDINVNPCVWDGNPYVGDGRDVNTRGWDVKKHKKRNTQDQSKGWRQKGTGSKKTMNVQYISAGLSVKKQ